MAAGPAPSRSASAHHTCRGWRVSPHRQSASVFVNFRPGRRPGDGVATQSDSGSVGVKPARAPLGYLAWRLARARARRGLGCRPPPPQHPLPPRRPPPTSTLPAAPTDSSPPSHGRSSAPSTAPPTGTPQRAVLLLRASAPSCQERRRRRTPHLRPPSVHTRLCPFANPPHQPPVRAPRLDRWFQGRYTARTRALAPDGWRSRPSRRGTTPLLSPLGLRCPPPLLTMDKLQEVCVCAFLLCRSVRMQLVCGGAECRHPVFLGLDVGAHS